MTLQWVKNIVLGLSGTEQDEGCSRYATILANACQADISAYLIRPIIDDPQLLMSSGLVGKALRRFIESSEQTVAELGETAHHFLQQATRGTVATRLHYQPPSADYEPEFPEISWTGDLVVVSHPDLIRMRYYSNTVQQTIETAGRPVLLWSGETLPVAPLAHVVLAWQRDAHHARALFQALPLLSLAQRVTIVDLEDDDTQSDSGHPCPAIAYLTHHGIQAQRVALPAAASVRKLARALDTYCDSVQASLVVLCNAPHGDLAAGFLKNGQKGPRRPPARPTLFLR